MKVGIKQLEKNGAQIPREGKKHSIYGRGKGLVTEVPRHTEIVDKLARRICRDIPFVR